MNIFLNLLEIRLLHDKASFMYAGRTVLYRLIQTLAIAKKSTKNTFISHRFA